ncbi:MAG TPA: TRAP transporter small permease [Alphaproteobacteria bacterium]|jgi:TRAP-type C4-dicarboxylate transport system permease small subunit|nr:TRAP transporter small permease [Alphaproteobacteria bacterium]
MSEAPASRSAPRRALDALYRGSGALSAFFLVAICAVVLLQVGANAVDKIAEWTTGEAIGLVVPSYAEFAGFFLAASSFLALAYTLRHGGHVRVSLLVRRFTGKPRRVFELWCCGFAALLCGYFAYFTMRLVIESWRFDDLSPGLIPVPLWIPQTSVALGLIILTVALADEFAVVLRGGEAAYMAAERQLEAQMEHGE